MTVTWDRDALGAVDRPSDRGAAEHDAAERLRTRDRVVMMHEALARRRLRRLGRVRGRTLL